MSAAVITVPAVVRGEVRHARFHPIEHSFRYRTHQWLVDADAPDVLPRRWGWLASFRAADHLGDRTGEIGENVRAFLRERGVNWTAHRIFMLTNARTFGYVFDPLSVFWVFDSAGRLEGVMAEVHNTYGERHGYVVRLDDRGSAATGKELYVSPFFGVFGDYQLKFVLEGDKVGVFVTLRQQGRVVFTGSFVGRPQPVSTGRAARVALTSPLMPQRVMALIKLHGVWLWLRRLPVVRRLPHREQAGAR
ncbi:MAG: DUF1365 domain-containing protein [Nocardioidaceae bacterium]